MKELISREQAIEYATQAHISGCVQQRIVDLLKSVPTVESRPKGKWIDGLNDRGFYNECSFCGHCHYESYYHSAHPNYCPNCGTEMAGGE